MIVLRHFNDNDISTLRENVLFKSSDSEIIETIKLWNTFEFNGKYFEMFAVCKDNLIVGTISLYQHDDDTIGIGPEIFYVFRKKGYASIAMKQALEYTKKKGYRIATAQIRKDNTASIKLHEKLGFVLTGETTSRRGNAVFVYLKSL